MEKNYDMRIEIANRMEKVVKIDNGTVLQTNNYDDADDDDDDRNIPSEAMYFGFLFHLVRKKLILVRGVFAVSTKWKCLMYFSSGILISFYKRLTKLEVKNGKGFSLW